MVEEANLPLRLRRPQILLEPRELLGIHVIAVQSEELDVTFLERVVAFAIHVEGLVQRLEFGIVMVAERSVKLYSGVEQGLVGELKFPGEVGGRVAAINVVAEHNDEIEIDGLAKCFHLLRDFVLFFFASAAVADDGEANGAFKQWKFYIEIGFVLGRERGRRDRNKGQDKYRGLS